VTYALAVDDVEQRGQIQVSETESKMFNRIDARELIDSLLKPPISDEEEMEAKRATWGMGNEQAENDPVWNETF
jgi:hypothetical protein